MSEKKKPENLIMKIKYDHDVATFTVGRADSKYRWSNSSAYFSDEPVVTKFLERVVAPRVSELLAEKRCGIWVGPEIEAKFGEKQDYKTVVVDLYELTDNGDNHLIYSPRNYWVDAWLIDVLRASLRQIRSAKDIAHVVTGDGFSPPSDWIRDVLYPKARPQYLYQGDLSAKPFCQPKYRRTGAVLSGSTPLDNSHPKLAAVAVAVAELMPSLPDIATRISALKGVFALATAGYDDVTDADIQAAIAAGYANPEVLTAVVDEIALIKENASDDGEAKGWDDGWKARGETMDENGISAVMRITAAEARMNEAVADVLAAEARVENVTKLRSRNIGVHGDNDGDDFKSADA